MGERNFERRMYFTTAVGSETGSTTASAVRYANRRRRIKRKVTRIDVDTRYVAFEKRTGKCRLEDRRAVTGTIERIALKSIGGRKRRASGRRLRRPRRAEIRVTDKRNGMEPYHVCTMNTDNEHKAHRKKRARERWQ